MYAKVGHDITRIDLPANGLTGVKRPVSQPCYYNLSGRKTNDSKRGLLIVRNADGTTRKILR
jgi:hypothetical protein